MANTNDLLMALNGLSTADTADQLARGQQTGALADLYGPQEAAELAALAQAKDEVSFGIGPRPAVVVLPGIMGSSLRSIRGMTDVLWINPLAILQGRVNLLDLGPDGQTDRAANVEIVPFGLEKMTYLKLCLALQNVADVYEFAYDWRRTIEGNADILDRCLERWPAGDAGRKFTLVGHSMGGLVARSYLARHPQAAEARLDRVISLGTPYLGAPEAVRSLVLGNSLMSVASLLNGANQPREFMLNLPGAYQIIPAPPDLLPSGVESTFEWELYQGGEWHLNGVRSDYLGLAHDFYAATIKPSAQVETIQIAGCNKSTLVGCGRDFANDQPVYRWDTVDSGPGGGDGTVPLASAVLPGMKVYYVEEVHRELPNNGRVIGAVQALLRGDAPDLDTAVPEHTGLFSFGLPEGEPETPAPEVVATDLRQKIENGTATRADLEWLFFIR